MSSTARVKLQNVAACAVLLLLVGTLGITFWRAEKQSRFDRTVWISRPDLEGSDTPRSRMVGDVMRRHLKPGMTCPQVHQLLGKPDSTSQFDTENHREGYGLGHIGAFGIDPSILVLQYDASGKLKEAHVIET